MLFGEFLIEHNVVNKEQLLKALVVQCRQQITVLEVLLEKNILNNDQCLEIDKISKAQRKCLLQVAKEQNFLTSEQIEDVVRQQNSSRKKIGEYLVELKFLPEQLLPNLLEKYFSTNKPIITDSPKFEQTTPLQSEAVKELDELQWLEIDASIAIEYADLFDSTKLGEMENLVLSWEKQQNAELLRSLFRELHTLKGTARFMKAYLSEKVIHRIEELVSSLIRADNLVTANDAGMFADSIFKGIDLISEIKDFVVANGNERSYWEDGNKRVRLAAYLQNLEADLLTCQKINENIDLDTFSDKF